jgi:hypothetical protein
MVGTGGHRTAEDFVRRRLEEAGSEPYDGDAFDLPYSHRDIDFTNFAGVIPGKNRDLAPLLLGAHYDSVIAAPCADDNGAAVAICFAVAEAAHRHGGLERDLIIAIFDAEEPPWFQSSAMGSNRFYLDQLDERGVHFAMIHDLVGHDVSLPFGGKDVPIPFIKDALFMTGSESHPTLSRIVKTAGIPKRIKLAATLNDYIGDMSDHGIFRKNGVPYLFFSCGMWAHYHQPSDTPDRLNYRKIARITELSRNILREVDGETFTESASEEDHTLEYEIETFKNLVGPLLPLVLREAGIKELKSREDIDRLVDKLLSFGLC